MYRKILATVLCFSLTAFAASDHGFKVNYDGGSLSSIKAGTDVKLYVDAGRVRIVKSKEDVLDIPAAAITEVSYGQDVHRRVGAAIGIGLVTFGIGGLMALTKSKKHFVGMTWDNDGKKGGLAFQADKGEYRGILTALEGVSGMKAINSDTFSVKN